MKTTTPNYQPSDTQPADLVPLQYAAKHFQIKEVTLRSWCKKGKIPWESRMQGDKARRFVRMSDVHAFLAKKTPIMTTADPVQPDVVSQMEQPHAVAGEAMISPESSGRSTCPADRSPPHSAQSTQQASVLTEAALPNSGTTSDCKPNKAIEPESTPCTQNASGKTEASPAVNVSQAKAGAKTSSKMPVAKSKSRKPKPSWLLARHARHAKDWMRKLGPDDLQKIAAWIKQRVANKFALSTNPAPTKQPTPAS